MALDISTLQDPRDYLEQHGEYALIGLYLHIYEQSLAIGDEILANPTNGGLKASTAQLIQKQHTCENWLGLAVDLLPKWAIEMLCLIDKGLEEI